MSFTKPIVDKLLSVASSGYVPSEFICEQILPFVGVKQKFGKLLKYGTNHLRIENSLGGGRGKYRQVEGVVRTTQNYEVEDHGLTDIISRDDYENAGSDYDAERDSTLGITTRLYLEKEKALADVITNSAVLTNGATLAGAAQFSDYTGSDPIAKATLANESIFGLGGGKANTLITSWNVLQKLRFHPQFVEFLGYKQARPGGLTDQELATVFGVERILVGSAMYDSSKEGQTSVLTPIWGKHMIFAVCPTASAPFQTSLGYRIGMIGRGARQVSKQPLFNPPGATEVLVEDAYDFLLSNVNAAYLLKNVIA